MFLFGEVVLGNPPTLLRVVHQGLLITNDFTFHGTKVPVLDEHFPQLST